MGDAQTSILIGCLGGLYGGFCQKHYQIMTSHYPFRPPAKHVAVVVSPLIFGVVYSIMLAILFFFDETPDIPRKDDLTFAFICSNAFFIAFNFFPSLNPFSCSECNLMKDTSAVLNKKFADNPLPAHKGDRTCVWCFADDSAEASVFECGHDVACRDCFHIFMAHGHKRCLRCGAKRVY